MVLELSDLAILGGGFATVVGGLWTLWKYIKSRVGKPRVVARISCRILDHQDSAGARIADIRLMVKNTGGERLTVSSVFMSVRGINTQTATKMNGPLNQANFPISIASKRRMFPDTWGHSHVDPGQMVSYKHLTKIPAGVKVINIHGRVECSDPSIEFATVSETLEV